ncbi:hypothetical protein LguiB_035843 [Lonicera macranthoides]
MAQEIEEVDDSESNKSGPSNIQEEKASNFGCSESVVDDSKSNKAGPSGPVVNSMLKTCYMHTDLTPTNTTKALYACLALRVWLVVL